MTLRHNTSSYDRREDIRKTSKVLEFFKENGTLDESFDFSQHTRIVTAKFLENLEKGGFRLPKVMPEHSISSYQYFTTNLALYLKFNPFYISRCVKLITEFLNRFILRPEDIFCYDCECMAKRNSLFGELDYENYYSHPAYISHLLVESIAARRVFFIKKIEDTLKKKEISYPSRILDIGCGMGGSLHLFHSASRKVGIDISYPMIEISKKVAGPSEWYESMDCTNIQYRDQSFDLVLCFDVLEHVTRPKHTLKEIRRLVKHNGLAVIVYPFSNYDWDSHISLVDKEIFDSWLNEFEYLVVEEVIPPGERFPCGICYLLKTQ